jgi:hypothetical protein
VKALSRSRTYRNLECRDVRPSSSCGLNAND